MKQYIVKHEISNFIIDQTWADEPTMMEWPLNKRQKINGSYAPIIYLILFQGFSTRVVSTCIMSG